MKDRLERIFKGIFLARPALTIITALILGPAAFLFYQCYYSPDVPFLFHHSGASWIRYPEPLSTFSRGYTDIAHFSKDFYLDQNPGGKVFVHLKAFREVKLYLNDFLIPPEFLRGENWKKIIQVEISQWIKPGLNSIRAEVRNPLGPGMLWLKIEGLKDPIVTDASWKVRIESYPLAQAILAHDTQINPDSLTVPTPIQSFVTKEKTILWIFVASIGLWGIGLLFFRGSRINILPRVVFAAILMVWIYLFLAKMVKIGLDTGFDATKHLDYIRFILKEQTVPLATKGWSMFHPPLFYLISSGFLEIFKPINFLVNPLNLVKVIPFLCGVGNVWMAYALGRVVFKGDPLKVLFAVVMAGIIPMNIYLSAYVGNEPLHALLVGCSLLTTVYIFRSSEVRFSQMIYLGLLLGLAILTKITAWSILPVVFLSLAYKMMRIDRTTLQEVISRLSLLLLVIAVISGWYYVQNIKHFGTPFMTNWNIPGHQWWQDPGFHTIKYYLSFGAALQHPYFASFHSFWDSMYSTFWGDGLIGGMSFLEGRPDVWNYDYMSAVYLLALPAAGIFLIGLLRAVQIALKDKEANSRLIMAFLTISLYSVGLFILLSTLRVPVYGQAKAFYCLSAIGPISVIFALGFGIVNDWLALPRLLACRAIFYGWFGTLIGIIFLSFGA